MTTIKLNGNYLEMYDSIDTMPITRFKEYNRYVAMDSGLGSDMNSFDGHISSAMKFYRMGEIEKADRVMENMRQNIYFVINKVSPKMNSFVCVIKSINGEPLEDITEPDKILDDLSKKGLTVGKVNGFLKQLKKKLLASLNCITPVLLILT
jgi:hypothetical protein